MPESNHARTRATPATAEPAPSDLGHHERATLGMAMQSQESLDRVRDLVEPADFQDKLHGDTLRAVCLLVDLGTPCDQIQLAAGILNSQDIDERTRTRMAKLIVECCSLAITSAGTAEYHANHVAAAARQRTLLVTLDRAANLGRSGYTEQAYTILREAVTTTTLGTDKPQRPKSLGLGATPTKAGHGYAQRFPVHVFPPMMRDYVLDIATRIQVPIDLPALTALGILGAVAGPRVTIRRDAEWRQPTNLYTIVAMMSGGAKSPAIDELRSGLWKAAQVIGEQRAFTHATRVVELKQLAEDLYGKANQADDDAEREALRADAKRAEAELGELENAGPPAGYVHFDGDTTVEALATSVARNDGAGAIIDDEGTFFRNLAGLYSGGKTGNLGIVLHGYDCRYYKPSRVSRECQPIERAALSLVISPQPGIVANLLHDSVMDDAGFVNRFVIAVPGDLVGQRVERQAIYFEDAPDERPATVGRRWWSELLASVAEYEVIGGRDLADGATIDLSREAFARHLAYENDFDRRLHPETGDLAKVKPWASKHIARVLRFAALLHLAGGRSTDERLSLATMDAAIEIGEWSVEHYLRAGAVSGLSGGAERIREYVDHCELGFVARKEIHGTVFARHAGRSEIDGWVDELVATGEYVVRRVSSGRGRPTEFLCRVGVSPVVSGI